MDLKKIPCNFCDGTGVINYFKGVSRFLLTSEDCPECGGMGFIVSEEEFEPLRPVKNSKDNYLKNKTNKTGD